MKMKFEGILFESYTYDADKDRKGDYPYEVCSSYKTATIDQAIMDAANDVKNWWKNENANFGGSVVSVDGIPVLNVLRSGNYECIDEEFKVKFEKYLYEGDTEFKEFLSGDSEYPLEEGNEPFCNDYHDCDEYCCEDDELDDDC